MPILLAEFGVFLDFLPWECVTNTSELPFKYFSIFLPISKVTDPSKVGGHIHFSSIELNYDFTFFVHFSIKRELQQVCTYISGTVMWGMERNIASGS